MLLSPAHEPDVIPAVANPGRSNAQSRDGIHTPVGRGRQVDDAAIVNGGMLLVAMLTFALLSAFALPSHAENVPSPSTAAPSTATTSVAAISTTAASPTSSPAATPIQAAVVRRPVVRPIVQPPTGVPAAIANLRPGKWLELPNTKIRSVLPAVEQPGFPAAIIIAWNGGTLDPIRNRLLVWGGGHNDYWGNEMYALDLPTLSIKRIIDPSPDTFRSVCESALPDGTPTARHTYFGLTYITHADRFFATSGSKAPCGFGTTDAWTYDFVARKWERKTAQGPMQTPFGTVAVYDPQTKLVFIKDNYGFYSYDLATNTFRKLNTTDQFNDYHLSGAIDTKRRKLVLVGDGVQLVDLKTNEMTRMTTSGTPGIATSRESPGTAYDPIADRIVVWHGGSQVWALNMDNGVWSQVATGPGPTTAAPYQGTFGRWAYVPAYRVFVVINDIDENAWVFRLTP